MKPFRLSLAAIVVLAGCTRSTNRSMLARAAACGDVPVDTARLERVATDTIARLRNAPQRVEQVVQSPQRLVVWTDDTNPQAYKDGGRVAFSCDGRISLVWLDGG
ncbi:MAG TPA: hypothetical protein VH277_13905 [Gemmatimonadaceae bacterium]|nr:hypothetical protein [Gemmatimonadaceae bacterium]